MSYTKKISALHHQVGTHHQLDGAGPLFLPRPCARRQVRADAAVFGYSERILGITSAVGVIWFVEPISYFPIVGVAGTYMAFVSGNISNLRIPCAMIAQKAAGVEPGTDRGSIVATLGMAVSIIVNVIILAAVIFAGAQVLQQLPEIVVNALQLLLPALFGAIVKSPRQSRGLETR